MSTLNPLPRLLRSNRLTTLAPSLSLPRSRSRSSYAYHIPPYAPKSTVPPSISNPEALTSTSSDLTPEQRKILDETIRVDQAGELGANYIYYGTTVALKMFGAAKGSSSTSSPSTFSSSPGDITASQVEEMWSTERHHLRTLNTLQAQHRVRPTLLWPVWKGMAFSLGAVTGMMGKESIMACTEAVETVIGEHYDDQIKHLTSILPAEIISQSTQPDPSTSSPNSTATSTSSATSASPPHPSLPLLLSVLKEFRDDELEHLDTAVENGAQMAPAHALLSSVIAGGCRGAIWISGKI